MRRPCRAPPRARQDPPTAGSRPAAPACGGTRPGPSRRAVQERPVLHVAGEHLDELRVESRAPHRQRVARSEEHTSELQSLMRISYAVFCLKKKKKVQ